MEHFLFWYLFITLLGWLTFPLSYKLFPALADRGYSLSRALGFLLWGFVYWIAVSFGLVLNEIGGLLFALILVIGLSLWALRKQAATPGDNFLDGFQWNEVLEWLKTHLKLVLSIEVLFLLAFAAWTFVRANNPDIVGTEKPMEVAFINAILHSPFFPPHDPWLSGYGISYYYFGYVLTAMLAMLTATEGNIAFNLMLALIFALSVIGAYGLLTNLLAAHWKHNHREDRDFSVIFWSLFGPLFLVLLGNMEGFLELLYSLDIGWKNKTTNFWLWLNMKDLNFPPVSSLSWNPRFWFWWRASRVLQDFDLRGNFVEVIDEFPFFSYLLGDLHPHVLAMPFGLLAVSLGLNLYLGGWQGETSFWSLFKIKVSRAGLILSAVVLGGLAFLNTWDFPVYLAVISSAYILFLVNQDGWDWSLIEEFLKFSIPLGLASILLYLPFYASFSSQAGGILPNIIFPTRGIYIWIMFGTLLIPMFMFMIFQQNLRQANWKKGLLIGFGLTLALFLFSLILGVIAGQTESVQAYIQAQGYSTIWNLLPAALLRRVEFGGGLIILILLVSASIAFLSAKQSTSEAEPSETPNPMPFIFLLILLGGLLVMAPEFFYLRDQFGNRMNTVFKFYYQAWTFWALAASFGFVVMITELRRFVVN